MRPSLLSFLLLFLSTSANFFALAQLQKLEPPNGKVILGAWLFTDDDPEGTIFVFSTSFSSPSICIQKFLNPFPTKHFISSDRRVKTRHVTKILIHKLSIILGRDSPLKFNTRLGYNAGSFQFAQSIPLAPSPFEPGKFLEVNMTALNDGTDAKLFMTVCEYRVEHCFLWVLQ
jgi:hypothetical protein